MLKAPFEVMKGTIWISFYLRVKVSWKTVEHKDKNNRQKETKDWNIWESLLNGL